MKAVLYPFMVLAACGLALSILANGLALAGVTIPGGTLVLRLHYGIFVVWLPAVITFSQTLRQANRQSTPKDFWKVALAGCPTWMRGAGCVIFGYAILNFVIFVLTFSGQPKQPAGLGTIATVRGFSSHWMIFYGLAFAILYSRIRTLHLSPMRKCPQGHEVEATARFCPECGHLFSHEPGNN